MKPKHLGWLLAGVAIAAIVAALVVPSFPRGPTVYIGTAQSETNWPYRYVLHGKAGARKGYVEQQRDTGWQRVEDMEIFEQTKNSLSFKTHVSATAQISSQTWHLSLQHGPEGLSGTLVNDFWDNKAVSLSFRRMGSM